MTRAGFVVEMAATDPGGSVGARAEGAFDLGRARVRIALHLDARIDPTGAGVELVVAGGTLYVRWPALVAELGAATPWVSAPTAISVRNVLAALGSVDPVAVLQHPPPGAVIDHDERGLVRRITTRFDAGAEGGTAVVTVRYIDPGGAVIIEPPPPAQVTDETDAFARRFGGDAGG